MGSEMCIRDRCTNELRCDDYEELDDFDSENFEVIGNMIDNPELLEV